MYLGSDSVDLRRLGIQAAARRFNGPTASPPASGYAAEGQEDGAIGDAPWFSAYSRRKAYIAEVNRRLQALWMSMWQSHKAPDDLIDEYRQFMGDWQRFVDGLSIGGVLLPSTEDYVQRVDKQVEEYSKRFQAHGGTPDIPGFMPMAEPPSKPFPWKGLFTTILVVAAVGGVLYLMSTAKAYAPPRAA